MAESVQIALGGGLRRCATPGVCLIFLSLITLGVYFVFWWYFINREMRDVGNANGLILARALARACSPSPLVPL